MLHLGLFRCLSVVDCGEPSSPDHCTKTGAVYTYDANVTYACIIGYVVANGSEIITCQANATWDDNPPVCIGKPTMSLQCVLPVFCNINIHQCGCTPSLLNMAMIWCVLCWNLYGAA